MRALVGILYLLTGLVGLCWFVRQTLPGMYGTPFSQWFTVILIGSLILVFGAILVWLSERTWTKWVPLIGSVLLAVYFLPAIVVTLRQYAQGHDSDLAVLVFGVATVLLVITSVAVAVGKKLPLKPH